jgi:hypothetical protein
LLAGEADIRTGQNLARGAPRTEAVVHDQLDADGPRIGEQAAVMGPGTAHGMRDVRHQALGARTHVQGLDAKMQSHRASMRIIATVRATTPIQLSRRGLQSLGRGCGWL